MQELITDRCIYAILRSIFSLSYQSLLLISQSNCLIESKLNAGVDLTAMSYILWSVLFLTRFYYFTFWSHSMNTTVYLCLTVVILIWVCFCFYFFKLLQIQQLPYIKQNVLSIITMTNNLTDMIFNDSFYLGAWAKVDLQ